MARQTFVQQSFFESNHILLNSKSPQACSDNVVIRNGVIDIRDPIQVIQEANSVS